jgi:hypothetical protein
MKLTFEEDKLTREQQNNFSLVEEDLKRQLVEQKNNSSLVEEVLKLGKKEVVNWWNQKKDEPLIKTEKNDSTSCSRSLSVPNSMSKLFISQPVLIVILALYIVLTNKKNKKSQTLLQEMVEFVGFVKKFDDNERNEEEKYLKNKKKKKKNVKDLINKSFEYIKSKPLAFLTLIFVLFFAPQIYHLIMKNIKHANFLFIEWIRNTLNSVLFYNSGPIE